jgi:riboflavin kinase/FMN adenylyltransferase
MKVFRSLEDYHPPVFPVVTIGTFDGVHQGHKRILDRLNEVARTKGGESLLLTFWPHPRMVLNPPDKELRLLNTIEEKKRHLEAAGLDNLVVLPFTDTFSQTPPYEFIRDILVGWLRVRYLIIGYDHRFGRKREGSLETLKAYAPEFGYEVEEIPAHAIDEAVVSSTQIRRALSAGAVETAREYLGYHYSLAGEVVAGDQLGRQLGFPTANISLDEPYKLIPGDGVYAITARLGDELYRGMLNIGNRPTIDGRHRRIEAHLFNFEQQIYGQWLRVFFVRFLREQRRFDSTEALREQLRSDKRSALEVLVAD